MIIIKFKFNGKEYCVDSKDNELQLGYLVNDNVHTDITDEEKALIINVVEKITPSNDLIYFHDIEVSGNTYKIYIDSKTKLKVFKPTPTEKDLIYLNKKYNNLYPSILYEENATVYGDKLKTQYEEKYFKILTTILSAEVVVAVTLGTNLGFNMLGNKLYDLKLEIEHKNFVAAVQKADYGINAQSSDEEIINAINQTLKDNPNITDEERELFLSNPRSILDNKKYIDFDCLLTRLKTLNIHYSNGSVYKDALGYVLDDNIYIGSSSSLSDCDKSVLTHEFSHLYSHLISVRRSILEPINTNFNDKYYNKDDSYSNRMGSVLALAKIIGCEPLKEYHFKSDDEIIINKLCEIIPDREKALLLLEYMEEDFEVSKAINEHVEANEKIYELFSEYYSAKYNKDMSKDAYMMINLSYSSNYVKSAVYKKFDLYDYGCQDSPSFGYNICLGSNVFSDDLSENIYLQEILYVFAGYDEEGNVIYDQVNGEKKYLCKLDELAEEDYSLNSNQKYLGTTPDKLNNHGQSWGSLYKIIPPTILSTWNDVELGVYTTDEDIINILMELIPDREKALEFISCKSDGFQGPKFEELLSEYYYAKYNADITTDMYEMAFLHPDIFESTIRKNYGLSDYDTILTNLTTDGVNSDLYLTIIDNTNYNTYKDEFGNDIKAIGLDNIKEIGGISSLAKSSPLTK